jgi:hypothetical protein
MIKLSSKVEQKKKFQPINLKYQILMYNKLVIRKKEEEDIKKFVKDGLEAIKHGRKGTPKPKKFKLNNKMTEISWVNTKTNKGEKELVLSEVNDVKSGITTKVLERIPKNKRDDKEKLCFSLVGEERTLDIECEDEQQKKDFMHIFKITLEQYKRNELKQIDSEEKELQDHIKALKKWNFDLLESDWKISHNLSKGEDFTEEDSKYISNCLNGNSTLFNLELTKSNINDAGKKFIIF